MTHPPAPEHFKGKSVAEHLKEARLRGAAASGEVHGTELPGHVCAFCDCAKDTANALLIFFTAAYVLSLPNLTSLLIIFSIGWLIWKTGRSTLLGYAKLERLHRVIEEERWEIEHHRDQEKQELTEMYEAKGLKGKLLEDVIEVLMADDNRLLRVMLEEELGLSLEAYEHPLKQGFGAALGAVITSILLIGAHSLSLFGLPLLALFVVSFCSAITAKREKRYILKSLIWNFSLTLFSSGAIYFLAQML